MGPLLIVPLIQSYFFSCCVQAHSFGHPPSLQAGHEQQKCQQHLGQPEQATAGQVLLELLALESSLYNHGSRSSVEFCRQPSQDSPYQGLCEEPDPDQE